MGSRGFRAPASHAGDARWHDEDILVSVHVNGPGSNDLKEEEGPVCCPLGAPLHGVKHASHLAQGKHNQRAAAC